MKKSLSRVVLFVLSISMVAAFSLYGCKKAAEEVAVKEEAAEKGVPLSALDKIKAEGRKPVVGFIYLLEADYVNALVKGAKLGAEEYGFELILKNSELDASIAEKNLKALIAQKVDLILLHTLEEERLRPAVIEAYNANIPVITVNLWVDAPHPAHIGVDYMTGGRILGEIVVEALDGKGTIVHVDSSPGNTVGVPRRLGMEEVLAEYSDIEILDTQYAEDAREKALVITEQFLTAYPDVDLIVSATVLQTLGVLSALDEAGKLGQIKVVTYDLPKSLLPEIESGNVYGASYDMPVRITKAAMDFAYFILDSVQTSDKWNLDSEATQEPAWKSFFSKIDTGSGKATINNIEMATNDAF